MGIECQSINVAGSQRDGRVNWHPSWVLLFSSCRKLEKMIIKVSLWQSRRRSFTNLYDMWKFTVALARDRSAHLLTFASSFFIWCYFIIYILSCDESHRRPHSQQHHMHSHTWASLMILLDFEFIAQSSKAFVSKCAVRSWESRAGLCTVLDEASRWLIYSTNNEHATLTLWLLSKLSARSSFGMITFFSRQPTWTVSSHTKQLQTDDAAAAVQQQEKHRASHHNNSKWCARCVSSGEREERDDQLISSAQRFCGYKCLAFMNRARGWLLSLVLLLWRLLLFFCVWLWGNYREIKLNFKRQQRTKKQRHNT